MPRTIAQLRSDANRLMKKGTAELQEQRTKPAASTRTVKKVDARTGRVVRSSRVTVRESRFHDDRDYIVVYGKARDLLLKHAFEQQLNPRTEKLYFEMIPDSAAFKKFEQICLAPLASTKRGPRMDAAKRLSSEARSGSHVFTPLKGLVLRHPTTVASMLRALEDESDPKVKRDLIIALGSTYDRYLKDQRIFPVLFDFFDSDNKELRLHAIIWTSGFPDREKWPKILEILQAKSTAPVIDAALRHVRSDDSPPKVPRPIKRKLQPVLLDLNARKGISKLNDNLFRAILRTLEPATVDDFNELVKHDRQFLRSFQQWSRKDALIDERDALKRLLKFK